MSRAKQDITQRVTSGGFVIRARRGILALPLALVLGIAVAGCEPAPGREPPPAQPDGARESVEIVIAATGDLNGWLVRDAVFPGEQRGLAHLAPVIARLRAEHSGLILLDGGDALAGSPAAARLAAHAAPAAPSPSRDLNPIRESAVLGAMNALRYDAAVPGNRDLGLGPDVLGAMLAASDFPWLAANVSYATPRTEWPAAPQAGPPAAPPFAPYVILQRGPPSHPVRIAILGLTTPGLPMWVSESRRAGLLVDDLEQAAAEWLPRLRGEADLVIALVHSGLDGDYEREEAVANALPLPNAAGRLAGHWPGFDLIVSASAHRLSPPPAGSNGAEPLGIVPMPDRAVPAIEPGSRGNGLAVARIRLEREDALAADAAGPRWRAASVALESHRAELRADPALLDLARDSLAADHVWLDTPTAVRLIAIPKRRPFFACAGALQHAAISTLTPGPSLSPGGDRAQQLPSPFHGEGKREGVLNGDGERVVHHDGEGAPFSLLPMLWREHYPSREELGQPLRRLHLFRWMPYEDRPVAARLMGRQIALLLEPYVRWRRGLVTPQGDVLHPGGLTAFWHPKGGEATALANGHWPRPAQPPPEHAPLLDPHETYPVWLSAFVATGGSGLAPKALLDASQLGEEAGTTIRELVFLYLSDPAGKLPKACRGWLAR